MVALDPSPKGPPVIHPVILWQLARSGAQLEPPRRGTAARRRVWRPLGRPGRRRANDDPTAPPSTARQDALAAAALHALDGRPREAAAACRAALEALESAGAVDDADRALRAIASALHPWLDVTVTSRTNRALATCDAPNCVGHRTRA
jgi:hypothetical protein